MDQQIINLLFPNEKDFNNNYIFTYVYLGVDLAALNIQRGRDHGLPGYSEYKHFCSKDLRKKSVYLRSHFNSRPVDSFEDLSDTFDLDIIAKLKEVYADVKDVDLFTGGQRYELLSSPYKSESLPRKIAYFFTYLNTFAI